MFAGLKSLLAIHTPSLAFVPATVHICCLCVCENAFTIFTLASVPVLRKRHFKVRRSLREITLRLVNVLYICLFSVSRISKELVP